MSNTLTGQKLLGDFGSDAHLMPVLASIAEDPLRLRPSTNRRLHGEKAGAVAVLIWGGQKRSFF